MPRLHRIALRSIFCFLTASLSAAQECGSSFCDSTVVFEIVGGSGFAVTIEKIEVDQNGRIDTLALGVDLRKSTRVRTVAGIHRISDLSELRSLRLGIFWADTIPGDLHRLENLNTLEIANFQITELPARIYDIHSLKRLDLEGTKLTSLDEKLGNLVNLEYLSLYASDLTSLPVSIGNLTRLRFLNLADNEISSLPNSILGLSSLDTLHCWYNALCDLNPAVESWIDSVEVSDGWKASQECPVSSGKTGSGRKNSAPILRRKSFNLLGQAITGKVRIFDEIPAQ